MAGTLHLALRRTDLSARLTASAVAPRRARRAPIERQHLAVAHQHLAVHDRRPHVVAARDVDEVRDRIVERRLPRRAPSTTMIRSARLPGLERADLLRPCPSARAPPIVAMSSAVCAGTRARDRASAAWRGTPPGASPRTCRDRCCWRRRRCRGRRATPAAQVLRRPARCRSPASCCFRGCARRRRRARFRIAMSSSVDPDAVRRKRPRPPEADRLEVRRRRRAVLLARASSPRPRVSAR